MKSLFFSLILVCSLSTFSQNLEPYYDKDAQLWGYHSDDPSFEMKPQFNWADEFHGIWAIIKIDTLYAVIDTKGQVVIPAEYSRILPKSEGVYYLQKPGNFVGIMNVKGEIILPFYKSSWGLSYKYKKQEDGYYTQPEAIEIYNDNKMDILLNDKILYDFAYDELYVTTVYFENEEKLEYVMAKKNKKWSMIDYDNKLVHDLPPFEEYIGGWPDYHNAIQVVRNEGEILFYDLEVGKILKSIEGHKSNEWIQAIIVKQGENAGLLGPDGKYIYTEGFKDLIKMQAFPNLFIACNEKDEWGIITTSGETQNEFYQLINDLGNSFHLDGHSYASAEDAYLIYKDGKSAMYQMNGNMLFPFMHEELGIVRAGYRVNPGDEIVFAGKDGELKLYNFKGELISDVVFDEIFGMWDYKNEFIVVRHEGKVKFFKVDDQSFHETVSSGYKYQSVENCFHKWGIVGQDGKIYLSFKYDGMYNGGDDRITIFHEGKEASVFWDENGIDVENIEWKETGY